MTTLQAPAQAAGVVDEDEEEFAALTPLLCRAEDSGPDSAPNGAYVAAHTILSELVPFEV